MLFRSYEEVTERIARTPGVTLAIPMVESAAGVSSQVHQSGALVRGIREADLKRLPGISDNVKSGELDGFDVAGGVAIGRKMADSLGVGVGGLGPHLRGHRYPHPAGVAGGTGWLCA